MMANAVKKKAPVAGPAGKKFAALVKALAGDPAYAGVLRALAEDQARPGKSFGSGALKADGKIFAMLESKGRFVVKLPSQRVDALVAAGAAVHFDPGHGRKMREWAVILGPRPSWLDLAREAHAFVGKKP